MKFDNTNIIKNKDVFSDIYTPRKIIGRKKEIKDVEYHMSFLFRENPVLDSMSIYGMSGTGKSLIIDYMLNELINRYNEVKNKFKGYKLKVIRMKGSDVYTKYKVLKRIYRELFSTEPSNTKDLHDEIINFLKRNKYYIYIFLDEIHEFDKKELNRVIYMLSRFAEDIKYSRNNSQQGLGDNDHCYVGYIIISNDASIKNKLNSNTKSTFQFAEQIVFNKYNAEEIFEILKARINEGGLNKNTITDSNIRLISALSADEGDARYAIHLLSSSAKLSEKKGKSEIKENVIKESNESLRVNLLQKILDDLNLLETEVLYYIYKLHKEKKMVTTGSVYEEMKLEKKEENMVSINRISQIVSDFIKNNVAYKGRTGGRGNTRRLDIGENLEVIENFIQRRGYGD